jgi:hypothetical protein
MGGAFLLQERGRSLDCSRTHEQYKILFQELDRVHVPASSYRYVEFGIPLFFWKRVRNKQGVKPFFELIFVGSIDSCRLGLAGSFGFVPDLIYRVSKRPVSTGLAS